MNEKNQLGIVELPNGYTEKDCIFDDSGNRVTNGIIRLLGYYTIIGRNSSYQMIQVRFSTYNGNVDTTLEIPVSIINSVKLFRYIPDGFSFFIDSERKQLHFLQKTLKLTIDKMTLQEMYTTYSGYNKLPDGRYIYILGDITFNCARDLLLKNVCFSKVNTFTPTSSNTPYTSWIKTFCQQSDNHSALFIASTVSLLKPLLIANGINTMFALYLVGETGKGKSEYAKLLTDIFEGHDNCRSLSSSQEDLFRRMQNHNDFLFLIDDLNKTDSCRVKNRKEAILSEIIQLISSGGSTEYKGEITCINTMLLITAEYTLKNPSSVNRCLIIKLANDFNAENLTWLQTHKGLYINFLTDYITWICQRYISLIDYIHNWLPNIEPFGVENGKSYAGLQRVQRTYKILQVATELYLYFLKDCLGFPEPSLNKLRNKFLLSINNCIIDTLEAIKKVDSDIGKSYVMVILEEFLFNNHNCIANSFIEYQKFNKKSIVKKGIRQNEQQRKLFFREDNYCYCITGKDLIDLFSNLDNFPFVINKKAISAQLNHHGLLKIRGGEYSFPLNGNSNKTRYYHLYIKRIVELIQDFFPSEEILLADYLSPIPELNDHINI